MISKVNQKKNAIFVSKNSSFFTKNDPQMEPKWSQQCRNFVDISGYPPKTPLGRPNGGQGAPKWSQNGAQSEPHTPPRRPNGGQGAPKWRQNGTPRTKWRHNGDSRGSKRIVVVVVVAAGRAQLASERSERASGAIDEAKCSPKGARRSHNGAPRGSKRICVVVVVAAGRAQLASERSERASEAIDVTGRRVTCVTRSP